LKISNLLGKPLKVLLGGVRSAVLTAPSNTSCPASTAGLPGVFLYKAPSQEELDHDFMWRCVIRLPERGRIGIFNRSYYEETLIVRVHQEFLEKQKLPPELVTKDIWEERFQDIRNFERYLARNGVVIRKFFLHVSKQEQKKRFLERIEEPEKHWKFSADDIRERQYWDDYMKAYEVTARRRRAPDYRQGRWSIRRYLLANLHFIRTASSRRMKPGGLPCLERTSSQSPVEPTTLTLFPFGMLPTFREEADGSSKTDVLRTV
jgi:hypothetical protein